MKRMHKWLTILAIFSCAISRGGSPLGSTKTETMRTMEELADVLGDYRGIYGHYPHGDNAAIVLELSVSQLHYKPRRTDKVGNVTDSSGRPLLIVYNDGGWLLIGSMGKSEFQLGEYVLSPPIDGSPLNGKP